MIHSPLLKRQTGGGHTVAHKDGQTNSLGGGGEGGSSQQLSKSDTFISLFIRYHTPSQAYCIKHSNGCWEKREHSSTASFMSLDCRVTVTNSKR